MLSAILIFEKDEKRDFSPRKNNPTRVDNLISYVGNICLTKLLLDVYSLNVIFAEHNHFRYRKYNYGTGLEKTTDCQHTSGCQRFWTGLQPVVDRAITYCFPLHCICLCCSPGLFLVSTFSEENIQIVLLLLYCNTSCKV